MKSNRIPATARGQLRQWLKAAQSRHERLEALRHGRYFDKWVRAFAERRQERTRGYLAIQAALKNLAWLELGSEHFSQPLCLFGAIRPGKTLWVAWTDKTRTEPLPPNMLQDNITIDYLLVGKQPDGNTGSKMGLWTAEVPVHALGRFFERCPVGDLDAALRELHHGLLAAPYGTDFREDLFIPAGRGVFLCEVRCTRDRSVGGALMVTVRAVTWLDRDQLGPTQIPLRRAVPGEVCLGRAHLLPTPLRHLERDEMGRISVIAHPALGAA